MIGLCVCLILGCVRKARVNPRACKSCIPAAAFVTREEGRRPLSLLLKTSCGGYFAMRKEVRKIYLFQLEVVK
ncbi:unnamed protein product [Mesocestoides corti]|uniref:Secreted protein n=1 Tax=Mesocestoides corti TaxID=53468 RepID=A0A0R3UJA1_MESCO|nr:unnamed protein product [Mesocestoides corti]